MDQEWDQKLAKLEHTKKMNLIRQQEEEERLSRHAKRERIRQNKLKVRIIFRVSWFRHSNNCALRQFNYLLPND